MTITISMDQDQYDIMTNPDNSIQGVLQILGERGMLSLQEVPLLVYSVRKKRYIATEQTFRQAGIYQGDRLRVNA